MARDENTNKWLLKVAARLREAYEKSDVSTWVGLSRSGPEIGDPITPHMIPKYFSGDAEPRISAFAKMCIGLKVSADKILFDRDVRSETDQKIAEARDAIILLAREWADRDNTKLRWIEEQYEAADPDTKRIIDKILEGVGKKTQ